MPAKIIVLEGLDCSFKETNSKMLKKYLASLGFKVSRYSFPNYDSRSSYFIKQYLKGERYGELDPKVISIFYSLDRYDTFKKTIEKDYNTKDFIILDRYIGSNIIYQGPKYKTEKEFDDYINWLYNFETGELGLPWEDITIFLRPEFEVISNLIKKKNSKNDIHEQDIAYQSEVYNYCSYIIDHMDWAEVICSKDGNILSRDEIFHKILVILKDMISEQISVFNSEEK